MEEGSGVGMKKKTAIELDAKRSPKNPDFVCWPCAKLDGREWVDYVTAVGICPWCGKNKWGRQKRGTGPSRFPSWACNLVRDKRA